MAGDGAESVVFCVFAAPSRPRYSLISLRWSCKVCIDMSTRTIVSCWFAILAAILVLFLVAILATLLVRSFARLVSGRSLWLQTIRTRRVFNAPVTVANRIRQARRVHLERATSAFTQPTWR